MNKLYLVMIAVLCAAALSSCSKDGEVYKIGVSQCSMDPWRELANFEMCQEAAYFDDMDVIVRSAHDDSQAQIRDIKELVRMGIDLLVVSPNESADLTETVSKVFESGIPVILLDRKTDNDKYTAFIGANNLEIGHLAGEYVKSCLDGKGQVAVIRRTLGSSADSERYSSFKKSLDECPGIRIDAEAFGNFTEKGGLAAARSVLDQLGGSKPDAVFALNDRMAMAFRKEFDERFPGSAKHPVIIGVDALYGEDGGMQYVADSIITASFLYPTRGDEVIKVAHKILKGEVFTRETELKTSVVDGSNVRVLQSQLYQINEQQEKISTMAENMDVVATKFVRQQQALFWLLVFAALAVVSFLVSIVVSRRNNRITEQLQEQNEKIKIQVDELEHQKADLIAISAQLEDTTQTKLNFFTNISHEFKTPLSLISGPIEDLYEMKGLPPETRPKIEILRRNSSKLSRLIMELLDFRSIENGSTLVNYSMGDIKEFISNILRLFDDVVERRRINFIFQTEGDDFNIPFDPVKTEKIVTNLLSNAFNHGDKEGTIKVDLEVQGKENRNLKLSVFNSGSFIPESSREKIFRRFYTMDAEHNGTGIGLALTTALVQTLGGTIYVESEAGVGTTFIVNIPIKDDIMPDMLLDNETYKASFAMQKHATMSDEEAEMSAVEEVNSGNELSVLLIDDNYDMRQYLKGVLSSGWHVIMAKDGEVGIEKAIRYRPDIILCDIMMPGKDGYEVCTTLKQNAITADIPIILLTACSLEDQKAKGYECGADAFMQKPFSVTTLKVRMNKLIEKDRKVREAVYGGVLAGKSSSELSSNSARLLAQVKEYVEEHISDEISIDSMIQSLGTSKSKFYRDIKEITSEYSPIDLVNIIRLRKAVDLIVHEHMNISEAAFASGFSSASYFSRTFQKYYHEKPSDHIKKITQGR